MGNKKRVFTLIMAVSIAMSGVTGCGSKLDDKEIAIQVGEKKITADAANFYARYQQAQYETYYASLMGNDMWSKEIKKGVTYEDDVKKEVIKSLEELCVVEQHAKKYKVKLTDEEKVKMKKTTDKFLEGNALEDKKAITANEKSVMSILELLTLQRKMNEAMTADVNTEVSDEEAAQKSMQYVEFLFTTTDEAGNTKTLSEDEKKALKEAAAGFAEGIKENPDFAAVATASGYEPKTAAFDASSTTPSKELITAAIALNEGQMTEVIESENGYYVGKITSLLDREATDAKKQTIINTRKQDEYSKLVKKWKKATDIKVNKKIWKKISFKSQGVTINQEEKIPYGESSNQSAQ
ncbi:MAG: peptidyl-prolyl cis-trans isomerase [Lachnospiraceae bacterium]